MSSSGARYPYGAKQPAGIVHARIIWDHSWCLSDDRICLRVRRVDNPYLRTDSSDQLRAAANGELGRC
jgi:hypothetical protein